MARVKGIVRGDREIIGNMRRVRASVGGRFMDEALRTGLKPMQEQTSENAMSLRNFTGKYPDFFPQPRGKVKHLDEGVVIAKRKAFGLYKREFWVTLAGRSRKIGHLVEFGTSPHFQPNFKGGWHHPGASAHPFFRPAYEETKKDVILDIGRIVWNRVAGSLIGSAR